MSGRVVASLVFALATLFSVSACKSKNVADAQPAAEAWLALVDAGDYGQSWSEAASFFKGSVDSAGWGKKLGAVRAPLGQVKSRTLKSSTPVTSAPGVPDGEYVVFQFATAFENKASATEVVTPMKDSDGQWRVSGYYIQ
jgi:hypothetical protein